MNKAAALVLFGLLRGTGLAADAGPAAVIDVRETGGVYSVHARFSVPQPAAAVRAVLTDYEHIPRFMPDMKKSIVHERRGDSALVEQEAVSKMVVFSKKVPLLLDITEVPGQIRFRDRCGKSFEQYEGVWTFTEQNGVTGITYELTARPAFDVPEFILKRLLKRDAGVMIDRLLDEIVRRAGGSIAIPR